MERSTVRYSDLGGIDACMQGAGVGGNVLTIPCMANHRHQPFSSPPKQTSANSWTSCLRTLSFLRILARSHRAASSCTALQVCRQRHFSHLFPPSPQPPLLASPGCGKTMLANAIAGELDLPYFKVSAPELIGGTSGDSERSIRDLFAQACEGARASERGCVVFIDEIDVIAVG